MATPSFIFDASKGETPATVAARRKTADALAARIFGRAPQNVGEGINALGQAWIAASMRDEARDAQRAGSESASSAFAQLIRGQGDAGSSPAIASPASVPAVPAAAPTGGNADAIRAGLIERGLSPAVTDGFIMNFQDESGLNPSINEAKPLVPGSRGGFGLAQWTGPRRVALEQFAQQSGRDVADPNVQMDFLMHELQGPEANAAKTIMSAQNSGDAAVAIAQNFLRPAQQHLDRRVARYRGAGAPVDEASIPANATPTQGVSPQAAPQDQGPSLQELIQLSSNPWLNDGQRGVVDAMLKQRLQQQDPMRQLDMQLKQGQLSALPIDQALKRKQLEKSDAPTSVQEYEFYKSNLGPDQQPMDYSTWSTAKARAAATNVTTNVGKDEDAFAKEGGKLQAQRFNDLIGEGQQAKQLVSDIATLTDLGKIIGTGKGAQVRGALGPFADAVGIKIDGLSDIQAFNSIVNRMAPALRVKGSGSQSDTELRNFLMSLPSLGNTPEGNELIGSVMNGLQQNKILAAEIGSQALNGEITRSEAEKRLRSLPDPMEQYRSYRKNTTPEAKTQSNAAPVVGQIVDNHRYLGGNPADQSSWEMVQ